MDPISQGALGAVVAAAGAPKKRVRLATLIGWAGGMLADADIFIKSAADPLLNVEYHRHFTHSLLFIPVGALICSVVFWPFLRKRVRPAEIYLYAILGYATAGLLDACTSYGTRLLWPFSDARIAWNVISIIDPVFTGTLLLLIGVGVFRSKPLWSRMAIGFVFAYLIFGGVQNHRATAAIQELALSRGHDSAIRFTAKPSIGNLLLWRGIYEFEGNFYVDAIRVPYLGSTIRVFEGAAVEKVDTQDLKRSIPAESTLAVDIDRFEHFSDGYLSWHPSQANIIGDARYAVVPDSIDPLWGIRIDRSSPDEHVDFINFRTADQEQIDRLKEMLFPD